MLFVLMKGRNFCHNLNLDNGYFKNVSVNLGIIRYKITDLQIVMIIIWDFDMNKEDWNFI